MEINRCWRRGGCRMGFARHDFIWPVYLSAVCHCFAEALSLRGVAAGTASTKQGHTLSAIVPDR